VIPGDAVSDGLDPSGRLGDPGADARLYLLAEQEAALEAALANLDRTWPGDGTAPRLGVLHQYSPIPLRLPGYYQRGPMPMIPSTISIVTPTLNAARFLAASLESVATQAYPRLQYVVQDGGSTDGTVRLAEQHRGLLTACHSEPDSGMVQAINRGFRRTNGEIMAYLNGDDLLLPGALRVVASYFARYPDVDVVYGHRVVIDDAGAEIGRWVLPPHNAAVLTWGDYIPQETLFWRRRIWERIGGALDETLQFALDWDLLLRFRAAGARFVRLPRFLGAFRVHDGQKTAQLRSVQATRERHALRVRETSGPFTGEDVRRGLEPYLRRHTVYQYLYELGVLRYG